MSLFDDIRATLNRHSAECISNTPDFILAEFLMRCLDAFNTACRDRDAWYGVTLKPGQSRFNTPAQDAAPEKENPQ